MLAENSNSAVLTALEITAFFVPRHRTYQNGRRKFNVISGFIAPREEKASHFGVHTHGSCLRHELYSPAQTLGSRVRIPLEAWMFV
jgi:hypothetical protein